MKLYQSTENDTTLLASLLIRAYEIYEIKDCFAYGPHFDYHIHHKQLETRGL